MQARAVEPPELRRLRVIEHHRHAVEVRLAVREDAVRDPDRGALRPDVPLEDRRHAEEREAGRRGQGS